MIYTDTLSDISSIVWYKWLNQIHILLCQVKYTVLNDLHLLPTDNTSDVGMGHIMERILFTSYIPKRQWKIHIRNLSSSMPRAGIWECEFNTNKNAYSWSNTEDWLRWEYRCSLVKEKPDCAWAVTKLHHYSLQNQQGLLWHVLLRAAFWFLAD